MYRVQIGHWVDCGALEACRQNCSVWVLKLSLLCISAVRLQGLMERFEKKPGGFLGFDLSSLFGQK